MHIEDACGEHRPPLSFGEGLTKIDSGSFRNLGREAKDGGPEGVWEVPEGFWEVSGAIFLRKMSRRRSWSRHGGPKMTARWPKMAPRGFFCGLRFLLHKTNCGWVGVPLLAHSSLQQQTFIRGGRAPSYAQVRWARPVYCKGVGPKRDLFLTVLTYWFTRNLATTQRFRDKNINGAGTEHD